MGKFLPFMTNDNSVGLFNENVNDIYHSAFGAKTEAYEKFVKPVLDTIKLSNGMRVLDICYGIGYNTKVFINEMLNTDYKIYFDCVDTDKNLIELSPFINTEVSFWDRVHHKKDLYKNISGYKEAKKILSINNSSKTSYKINNVVNVIILKNLIEQFGINFLSNESKLLLTKNENFPFMNKNLLNLYKFYQKNEMYLYQIEYNLPFVHNIYYKYIAIRNKIIDSEYDFSNINMNFIPLDVRQHILNTDKQYNIVFLDGFTPAKCPCIWSVEFFKRLYELLDPNGIIVTYNMSAPVRSAMKLAGFTIGKTMQNQKEIGTVAAKNSELIKHRLSDTQEGLLNTKAGIPYRDKDLTLENEAIITNRKKEVDDSDLISSSKYLKGCENEV